MPISSCLVIVGEKSHQGSQFASGVLSGLLPYLFQDIQRVTATISERKSTGDVFSAFLRDEPGALMFHTRQRGRGQVVGTLRLRHEQKTLSPVIGERAVAVGRCFSRPRRRPRRVPGC